MGGHNAVIMSEMGNFLSESELLYVNKHLFFQMYFS